MSGNGFFTKSEVAAALWPPARIARTSSQKPPAFAALPLFALFYQVEDQASPAPLKKQIAPFGRASDVRDKYNAIMAILPLPLPFPQSGCGLRIGPLPHPYCVSVLD